MDNFEYKEMGDVYRLILLHLSEFYNNPGSIRGKGDRSFYVLGKLKEILKLINEINAIK